MGGLSLLYPHYHLIIDPSPIIRTSSKHWESDQVPPEGKLMEKHWEKHITGVRAALTSDPRALQKSLRFGSIFCMAWDFSQPWKKDDRKSHKITWSMVSWTAFFHLYLCSITTHFSDPPISPAAASISASPPGFFVAFGRNGCSNGQHLASGNQTWQLEIRPKLGFQ